MNTWLMVVMDFKHDVNKNLQKIRHKVKQGCLIFVVIVTVSRDLFLIVTLPLY